MEGFLEKPFAIDEWVMNRIDRSKKVIDLSSLFGILSVLSDFGIIWPFIAFVDMLLRKKKVSKIAYELGWAGFSTLLTNRLLKHITKRSRPERRSKKPDWVRESSESSFPSGHSAAAICAPFLLGLSWRWKVFGVLVGLSRIYLEDHYFSDVIAGFLEGLILFKIGREAEKLVFEDQRNENK